MKKIFAATLAVLVSAGALYATEKAPRNNTQRRGVRMSLPVYAPAPDADAAGKGVMNPEKRAAFDAARRRRFEIMVLISAYKIMPEKDRPAIRAELLKRIDADFQVMIEMQKARIAKAEKDLQRFRNELAEREKNRSALIEQELERLVKITERRPAPKKQK